jgi:hypothetical protein
MVGVSPADAALMNLDGASALQGADARTVTLRWYEPEGAPGARYEDYADLGPEHTLDAQALIRPLRVNPTAEGRGDSDIRGGRGDFNGKLGGIFEELSGEAVFYLAGDLDLKGKVLLALDIGLDSAGVPVVYRTGFSPPAEAERYLDVLTLGIVGMQAIYARRQRGPLVTRTQTG